MKDKAEQILNEIHEGWIETQQDNLFSNGNSKLEKLEQACVSYLKHKGYKIIEPVIYKYNIKKLEGLIKLFYLLLDRAHPEYTNIYRNLDKDRVVMKRLIESRLKNNNLSKEAVLNECAEIIDTIFEHEVEFKFRFPISLGMLGQKNCGWITEKAIQIMNNKKINYSKEKQEQLITKYEENYNEEEIGFNNLDINSILESLGE